MTTKDLEGERKDVRFVKGGLARAIRTLRAAVGPRPRIACQRSSKTDEFSTLIGLIGSGPIFRGS